MDSNGGAAGSDRPWERWLRADRVIARYGVLCACLLIVVLVGFGENNRVFAQLRAVDQLRLDVRGLLRLQLDEETAVRGYDATGSALFLEPYRAAQAQFPQRMRSLESRLASDAVAMQLLQVVRNDNDRWLANVAAPIVRDPNSLVTAAEERLGKGLVDHLRASIFALDARYAERAAALQTEAMRFQWFGAVLVVLAILAVAVVAYVSDRRYADRERTYILALTRLRDDATRLSDWRSKVIAVLAHDFKSTLSIVTGYTGMLEDFPERRNDPSIYENIREAARSLASMADEALLMARVASGALVVAKVPVTVDDLLDEVARRYRRGDRKIVVRPSGLRVYGDRDYLLRVLDNLVSNAAKYSPESQPIELLANAVAGGSVEICVNDRGDGIAPEEIPHIFEEYWRSPEVMGKTGAGVGLFMVKKIVDAHHGTIAVNSRERQGTSVCIRLRDAALPT